MEPIITINEYPIGWEWLDKVPLEQNKEVQTKIKEIIYNKYLIKLFHICSFLDYLNDNCKPRLKVR